MWKMEIPSFVFTTSRKDVNNEVPVKTIDKLSFSFSKSLYVLVRYGTDTAIAREDLVSGFH